MALMPVNRADTVILESSRDPRSDAHYGMEYATNPQQRWKRKICHIIVWLSTILFLNYLFTKK